MRSYRIYKTRMHSSGMCTARLLTVSQHALRKGLSAQGSVCQGGVCSGGVSAPEGCLPRGCLTRGCLPRGCLPMGSLLSGVSAQGGVCPGGVCLGGVCRGGVCLGGCLPRGCLPSGVSALGDVSQHAMGQTLLWTDRHLWKHKLHRLSLRALIKVRSHWGKAMAIVTVRPGAFYMSWKGKSGDNWGKFDFAVPIYYRKHIKKFFLQVRSHGRIQDSP